MRFAISQIYEDFAYHITDIAQKKRIKTNFVIYGVHI